MTAAITHSVEPAGPVEPVEADAGKQTPLEEAEALVEQLSLQDAFKRFQQRRQAERKDAARAKKEAARKRQTPEFKRQLRERFVAQAESYLGVPYGKRYHAADACDCEGCTESKKPLVDQPLFLDCCALVRRCVKDLRMDFGFQLKGGNQAYQFDTLPIRVESITDLEPGDLVFYEGEYYSPTAKRQLHDMVHVEIFTGRGPKGEGVIGSREQKKWVKEYDDYRIEESKRWKLIRYHFVKLDTWLEGTCKSFCKQHDWKKLYRTRRSTMSQKSVFAVQAEQTDSPQSDAEQGASDASDVEQQHDATIQLHKPVWVPPWAPCAHGVRMSCAICQCL